MIENVRVAILHDLPKIKFYVLIVSIWAAMTGCLGFDQPEVEDITSGHKWNLQIGASCDSVYQDLVELGEEKDFGAVALVGQKTFDDVHKIRPYFPYYNWVNFISTVGYADRVLIGLDSGRVSAIYAGGAMLDSVGYWPRNLDDEVAIIHHGDTFDELEQAFEAIQNHSHYQTYQYLLPDKPLHLPFDPAMRDISLWYFTFQEYYSSGELKGHSQVRLYFENEKLVRINHTFTEN